MSKIKHIQTSLLKALFAFVVIMYSVSGTAQNCSATLEVEKGRASKSAFQKGAFFNMILTNTSSSTVTFDLAAVSTNTKCSDSRMTATGKNVIVDTEIVDSSAKNAISGSVTLRAGEVYEFKVRAKPTEGTPTNKWSCVTVKALPQNCKSASIETVLKVFVPNATQH